MKSTYLRILAMLLGVALIASACGGGDTDSASTDSASSETATETEESSSEEGSSEEAAAEEPAAEEAEDEEVDLGGAVDESAAEDAIEEAASGTVENAGAASGTLEELEAKWAEERAAIVQDIIDNGYGVDGDVLTGPAGFTIDLSSCPADWADNAGIVDGTINIGYILPQSGPLAAYGNIGTGINAYVDFVNDNGGIGPEGYTINMVMKDDAYEAAKTKELTDELLQSANPFYISNLGSPNTFAIYDQLNAACVPQPFVFTGHQAWGDPENHPWTTGLQLSYATEALLWGSWIEENLADKAPVTVGALVMDNDFGLAYEQAFARYAEDSQIIGEVEFVRHDPAAATLTNELTTIAAADPDVYISMTAGNPCVLSLQEAARAGLTESADAYFTSSVCKAIKSYMEPAGKAAANWYVMGGGQKDNTDDQYADDPFIVWLNEEIAARGGDPSISLQGTGFGVYAWAHIQSLQIAAELPGGLTRTNLMLAIRSLDMTHPALLEGMSFAADGNADAYFVEGSDISQFDYDNQSWIIQGGVIDLNGQSDNCAWVSGEGC